MKNTTAHEFLSRLRSYFQEINDPVRKYANEPPPLRAELYNTRQMEHHGRTLAKKHKTGAGLAKDLLLKRLADNEKMLVAVRNLLADAIKEKNLITPGGEWLLDNFYLIEEHIRTGKRHLPKGYSQGLPWLSDGPSAGLPRVYDIALEIISHSDGRIDVETLGSFIKAYQEVSVLQLGELWAIPIMLRLALIENLRRVSARIAVDRINQNLADYWSGQMIATAENDPKSLILVIADMARSGPPMESSFVAELTRQLMWKGPSLTLPLTWMEQRLSESGMTSNELVNSENQKQAADQVSISNTIGSLRFINALEWREFVESMSLVERILHEDIGGTYLSMDFATRDHYRHVVEKVAKHSSLSENEVATIAIRLAKENAEKNGTADRASHVGYYLVDKGLIQTEKLAQTKYPWDEALQKKVAYRPLVFYLGSIGIITLVLSGIALWKTYADGIHNWLLLLVFVLSAIASSQLALTFVNWLVTLLISPNLLPRMDYSKGIPRENKTLVVVPTIIFSIANVEALVEGLEIRFLANRAANLHYGLLTDYADAEKETLPGDEIILETARKKIEELNEKYSSEDNDIFFLFHRPRKWNPADKIWMGYERKRGKLTELNALLSNGEDGHFSLIEGDLECLKNVRYVITLDTDTLFPHDAGWKLIATMAHPLNRPVYDEVKQRVTEGYSILQPRVAVSLPRGNSSLFSQMHANDAGIDPYTRLVSDVYQDLFAEGSFIGKGIYEIKTFDRALNNRFPENRILSHDLLEGCYARAGLLSDVQLYEENPTKYSTDVSRRHRWIRGDWQISWWFLPIVPDANRKFRKNPLPALSRWKIFDNLRRSLVPLAMLLLFICGWTVLKAPWFWTLCIIGVVVLPSVITVAYKMMKKPIEILLKHHILSSLTTLRNNLYQNIFSLVSLPYEAYFSVDAILRTNWRMLISHKKLLEWKPAGHVEARKIGGIWEAFLAMWISPLLSLVAAVYLSVNYPFSLFAAMPLLILWAVAPAVAWKLSKTPEKQDARLSASQVSFLRRLARKTWNFFETFVGAEDNWLPPDNYQEDPKEVIAHRTSPTNIGMSLLANLTAYDFGYISQGYLLERTTNTINTLTQMERSRGHLYNWYDTVSLAPLPPRYISTVDSGNFAGHMLTLRQGLLALAEDRIIDLKTFEGLRDTLGILEEQVSNNTLLNDLQIYLETICLSPLITLEEAKRFLDWLKNAIATVQHTMAVQDQEVLRWLDILMEQCTKVHDDMVFLAPWLGLPSAPESLKNFKVIPSIPTLSYLAQMKDRVLPDIDSLYTLNASSPENKWLDTLKEAVIESAERANERMATIEQLAEQCNDFAELEYEFLYDRSKHLLTIGYNVDENRKDSGSYDLLASEARLANFVAIAQGKLPQESWFTLGRLLTDVNGASILLSWSGSAFEYLMPLLVMPTYENTLLDQTNKAVVDRQIEYGQQRGVPWGISESGYNMVDANFNYQYRAFGVPGLGLKRGLSDDLVIAPYASMLSLMVAPYESCVNLERMASLGFQGRYGFYEAIDYTPSRIPRGQENAIVQSFMAHHQGMGLLSIAYVLLDRPMQRRFSAELQFQATSLLLQERIPKATIPYTHTTDVAEINFAAVNTEMRIINTPNTPIPEIQLISNGKYHAMVTNSGGGYSRWKDLAVTRWREDTTCDNWGVFCYIRDLDNNIFWSNAYQPTLKQADSYEVTFAQGRAEFRRHDNNIETYTEIVVSPEDDVELRRIHLTNRSRKRRTIEITSYAEVVLNTPAGDTIHPAFSNLFVQTEIVARQNAIICTRRPRSEGEQVPWMCHVMKAHEVKYLEVSYETDRMEFIGRGNTAATPAAMGVDKPLSGKEGSVLDPIVAIRYKFVLEAGASATFDMLIGIGETKEGCQALVDKYQDRYLTDRVLEMAWTHSQVVLRQINATEVDAQLYNRLASSVIFVNPQLRADKGILLTNQKGQSGLWSYSISGDLPIVLLRIVDSANLLLTKQMIQAHAYWRLKGLAVDLVIWNEVYGGYRQNLQEQISGFIAAGMGINFTDRPGGIFIRPGDQISNEDRILFQTVARLIISDDMGTLADQVNSRKNVKTGMPALLPTATAKPEMSKALAERDLAFFNETGGFSADGREYIIISSKQKPTPAPWVNVLANPHFGTVISESGQSYTWLENAHEMRLSPWNNDPVSDAGGEVFYIRDEESGHYWSPTLLPAGNDETYITRHGFGYSVFEHSENGIFSEVWVYVDIEASIKYVSIKLRNDSARTRSLSVTGYVEWVLGDTKAKSAMHVVSGIDPEHGVFFAKNPYNAEFPGCVAFFDTDALNKTLTGDRAEFIGRNGSLQNPAAMKRTKLSGRTGASMDPCAAIQVAFDLLEGQEHEINFSLGAGKDMPEALNNALLSRGSKAAQEALEQVRKYWKDTLNTIQVETPDDSLNILTNGWLVYQTLACRLWARSGYYQSGGAFGFRDQLQDVLSLLHAKPKIARGQILLCASRQFKEGDVQHWWHPPTGRGVRTMCSDDFLWLPFVTARYVKTTGDKKLLDEVVPFLEGRLLNPDEESYYDMPVISNATANVYEHCVAAVKHGLRFGSHGLPLIGSGDWNDGMDRVGRHGKGESIWLAFFLYYVLTEFKDIAVLHNDPLFAEQCEKEAQQLKENIDKNGWDGEWYRRAYFDDGTPLGSKANAECRIDSISQSWSVLSGAGAPERSAKGMNAANNQLVHRDSRLIQLLDPPFDKTEMDPGYIKGYVPGVRENGGQYTHAAIWMTMAAAKMGNTALTWELLQMINPLNHGKTAEDVSIYKVEPYVMAADVYGRAPHTGRGGWTWYTGSAGWMYQLIIESFLGLKLESGKLIFTPCLPAEWNGFTMHYKYKTATYHIQVTRAVGESEKALIVDGVKQPNNTITMADDGVEHAAELAV